MLKGLAEDLAIKKAMLNARLRKRAEKQHLAESQRRAWGGGRGQDQDPYQLSPSMARQSSLERAESKDGQQSLSAPASASTHEGGGGAVHPNPKKSPSPPSSSVEEQIDAEANEALEIAALER